ncbi:hypothetical protein GE21DRAFT_1201533 [Neurospora crassa]|nr:hypothetical protein B14D6.180 [imported] - Neurospora crassa [Neurospora crassa]KHE87615.1 hypothetical protein GE21DRAFT_1201533 [Neurospora crassa]
MLSLPSASFPRNTRPCPAIAVNLRHEAHLMIALAFIVIFLVDIDTVRPNCNRAWCALHMSFSRQKSKGPQQVRHRPTHPADWHEQAITIVAVHCQSASGRYKASGYGFHFRGGGNGRMLFSRQPRWTTHRKREHASYKLAILTGKDYRPLLGRQ